MPSTTPSGRENLQFFGKISASVSHEIKNVFAVINEAAGLIEDFTLMEAKGIPIDPARLKKATNSIQRQVQRGDAIVKNINSFAHCANEETREVDLLESLDLTVALSTRMADMKQMTLEVGECEHVTASLSPFDLMRLLHIVIATTLDTMSQGEILTLAVKPTEGGATFTMAVPGQRVVLTANEDFSNLAEQMNITATNHENDGILELYLVRSI